MCIKNTEKRFIQLQKQRIKFFFFLVVSNLTYGKNISDNEHQLIFSIRYSVFGIRIVESEQYYSYSVFGLFSKNELFGIRYSLNFQKRIYLVFGIRSIFTIRCNSGLIVSLAFLELLHPRKWCSPVVNFSLGLKGQKIELKLKLMVKVTLSALF